MASETEELESLARDLRVSSNILTGAGCNRADAIESVLARLDRQERVIAVLRAGLEPYADRDSWRWDGETFYGPTSDWVGNGWDIAQQTLAEADKIGEGEK